MRAHHATRKRQASYECSLCRFLARTRYGFRAHMLAVHAYRSTAHAIPGTGFGKRNRRAEGSL